MLSVSERTDDCFAVLLCFLVIDMLYPDEILTIYRLIYSKALSGIELQITSNTRLHFVFTMMNRFVSFLVIACALWSPALAFQVAGPRPATTSAALLHRSTVIPAVSSFTTSPSSTALNVFGNRKPASSASDEDDKYWQGEWVCKDCGYIYNRVRSSSKTVHTTY